MRVAAFVTLALYTLVAPVFAVPIQAGTVEIAARSVENHLEARDHEHVHSGERRHPSHDINGQQRASTPNIQATSKRSVETLERRKFWDVVKKVGGAALKVGTSLIFRREDGSLSPLERRSIVGEVKATSASNIQATSKRSVETLERRKFWDVVKKVGGAALKVGASLIFRREGGPLPPLERRSIVGQVTGLNKRDPIFTVRELE